MNGCLIEFLPSEHLERADPDTSERIVWCAVGKAEKTKCDFWSGIDQGKIDCAVADTAEECIQMIMVST